MIKYGIKITKPWSKEMYDHNDLVSDTMKHNIVESIVKYQNDFDKLNDLMVLCGGIKYGDGYSIDELYADVHDEVYNVQNYWLHQEYPYYVEKGLVEKVDLEFIGYE
jgi:hypothetical protein|tara:strand:+ start:3814 stop:4134 length:321 start_codon:yes stop_codon:yes gene_type:complete